VAVGYRWDPPEWLTYMSTIEGVATTGDDRRDTYDTYSFREPTKIGPLPVDLRVVQDHSSFGQERMAKPARDGVDRPRNP
jgi:hypothetical protein